MVVSKQQNQVKAPKTKDHDEPEGVDGSKNNAPNSSKVGAEELDMSKDGGAHGDEVVDVEFFRRTLRSETLKLQELCEKWQNVEDIPQNWTGEVCATVGKAKLLIAERFDQFSGLVDDCEFCRGEKKTTCEDLAGFWDMVFLQVEVIMESFERLDDAKEKGWPEQVEETIGCTSLAPKDSMEAKVKVAKVKVVVPKKKVVAGSGKSNIRAMIAARRAEMEGIAQPGGGGGGGLLQPGGEGLLQPHQDVKTFEGGFFNIKSPMGKPKVSPRSGNRAAVLGRKVHNLPDLSPLAKVSAQMKHNLEKTTRTRLFLETDDIAPSQA